MTESFYTYILTQNFLRQFTNKNKLTEQEMLNDLRLKNMKVSFYDCLSEKQRQEFEVWYKIVKTLQTMVDNVQGRQPRRMDTNDARNLH